MHITRVPFDPVYWEKQLKPALTNFYYQVRVCGVGWVRGWGG